MPGRSLQQLDPNPRFELLDYLGRGRGGQREIFRRANEAAALHDAREDSHGLDPIHSSVLSNSDFEIWPIIWRGGRVIYGSFDANRVEQETHDTSNAKLAVVTGASRGLGRNMAIALARKGVDLIRTYHSNKAEADGVAAAIEALGRKRRCFSSIPAESLASRRSQRI
jgi:hypothetical protein